MKKKTPKTNDFVHFCQDHSLDAVALDNAIAALVRHDQVVIGTDGRPHWTARGKAIWENHIFANETDQVLVYTIFLALQIQELHELLTFLKDFE